ncbi:PREDICTED: sodium/hydrogen exchanger 10-like [Nicrophorus vespilloides]|uniref:Sodium/hydrogen exchanger 10-like n=1 Tax=Nicrophorus vespilloides TaxID=110193 RepID=A0ABM1M012_NICVS|nr:PREDICTED: sodium/hydrogen exchanger 10-like [Nicrophorus vespilloides]
MSGVVDMPFGFPILGIAVVVGVMRTPLSKIYIPHQLIIILVACTLSNLQHYHIVADIWTIDVDADTWINIVSPIIVLKITYTMDNYLFLRSLPQILIISTIGFSISTALCGTLTSLLLKNTISVYSVILAGVVLSVVDMPDSIFSYETIRQTGVFMGGDCIIGLTIATSTLQLLIGIKSLIITEWYHIVMILIRHILCGGVVGYINGKVMAYLITGIYNDSYLLVSAMLGSSYVTFMFCEVVLFCSGSFATFILVMFMSRERARLSGHTDDGVVQFLDSLYDIIEIIIGVVIVTYFTIHLMEHASIWLLALSFGVFIIITTCRFMVLLILSPVLSRIGYGFTFSTMFCLYWGARRYLIQLMIIYFINDYNLDKHVEAYICFTVTCCALTLLLNVTTLKIFLIKMKLMDLSNSKKRNIQNCIKYLFNTRTRILSIMKMNRIFSDANWPMIQERTKLLGTVVKFEDSTEGGNVMMIGQRQSQCPSCHKTVMIQPTKKELVKMKAEVNLRILKTEKISYIRQYEDGLLNKEGVRVLMQAVEMASDSADLYIKLDELFIIFKEKSFFERTKMAFLHLCNTEIPMKVPRQFVRSQCYRIMMHRVFDILVYIVTMLFCIVVLFQIFFRDQKTSLFMTLVIIEHFFFIFYVVEFEIKLLAYSHTSKLQGFRSYMRCRWNQVDFIALVINSLDWFYSYIKYLNYTEDEVWHIISEYFRYAEAIRLIKMLKVFQKLYPKFLSYCDKKIDTKVSYAFRIGMALVVAFEEVIEMLPYIADNKEIKDELMFKLNSDRLAITQQLALIQKDRPWITITVKTKQAVASTLKHMQRGIMELKQCGITDKYEFNKLNASLEERLSWVWRLKSLQSIPPKTLFYEIPWMVDEMFIVEYLYENVATKVWDAGDVICEIGDVAEGVFILVAGVLKVTYVPNTETLENMSIFGTLPIREILSNKRFNETQTEYLMMGNSMGELAVLTGRPYNCTVVSDTPSQTFFIPAPVLLEAIEMSKDPVDGLSPRLWKYITVNLAKNVLMDTHIYQSTSNEQLRTILGRAFVPNLAAYKMFVLSEMIEDIILIEGLIVDFNTREIYTAPLYIPRTVNKILLPSSESFSIENITKTILMIIPDKEADDYELMERSQAMSDLIANPPKHLLVHASVKNKTRHIKNMLSTKRKRFGRKSSSSSQGSSRSSRSFKSRIYSRGRASSEVSSEHSSSHGSSSHDTSDNVISDTSSTHYDDESEGHVGQSISEPTSVVKKGKLPLPDVEHQSKENIEVERDHVQEHEQDRDQEHHNDNEHVRDQDHDVDNQHSQKPKEIQRLPDIVEDLNVIFESSTDERNMVPIESKPNQVTSFEDLFNRSEYPVTKKEMMRKMYENNPKEARKMLNRALAYRKVFLHSKEGLKDHKSKPPSKDH